MTWQIRHDTSKKPWSGKFVALFAAIQLTSLVLTLVGIPLLAVAAWRRDYYQDILNPGLKFHWNQKWLWIYDNEEDGIAPVWYNPSVSRYRVWLWTAIRNSCNNLRYVRGVSDPTYPIFWAEGTLMQKPKRVLIGWNHSGSPTIYFKSSEGDAW